MKSAQEQTVSTFLEAFAAGNLEGAMSCLHPEVVIEEAESLPHAGRHVGHQGFVGIVTKMLERLEATLTSIEIFDAGTVVVSRIGLTLTSRATRRELHTAAVEIYTVRDGKILHADVYYKDTLAVSALAAES